MMIKMKCNVPNILLSTLNNHNCRLQNRYLNNSKSLYRNGLRYFHEVKDSQTNWSVLNYIYQKQLKTANRKYTCLLLNLTDDSFSYFKKNKYIWNEASLRISVDGSANCLARKKMIHTADVVCGDFDSIDVELIAQLRCHDEAVRLYQPRDYHGSTPPKMPQVIETPSQRETDFTKALHVAMTKRPDINFFIGLYYSDGSRIDHLFGLVNTLHLVKKTIFLVNIRSETISWLLVQGNHVINKPKGRALCSLVPFTGLTELKTQGLEYNIGPSSPLSFGGIISTSNICREDSEKINIETSRDILWSVDAIGKPT